MFGIGSLANSKRGPMTSERMISRLREGEIVWNIHTKKGSVFKKGYEWLPYRDRLHRGHPEQVIGMWAHTHHFGNNGDFCPLNTEDIS